jgi:hypothetical protein
LADADFRATPALPADGALPDVRGFLAGAEAADRFAPDDAVLLAGPVVRDDAVSLVDADFFGLCPVAVPWVPVPPFPWPVPVRAGDFFARADCDDPWSPAVSAAVDVFAAGRSRRAPFDPSTTVIDVLPVEESDAACVCRASAEEVDREDAAARATDALSLTAAVCHVMRHHRSAVMTGGTNRRW